MQDSNQSDIYSTDQNIQTSENSKSNIRFEYNTHGIKDQINLNEDQFMEFLNDILNQHKNGEITDETKNKMKDIFPFLENRVPMFMDVNIILPEKKAIENLEEKNGDLLSFQKNKVLRNCRSVADFGGSFGGAVVQGRDFRETGEGEKKVKKMIILKPRIEENSNFEQFQKLESRDFSVRKRDLGLPKMNSFNIFSQKNEKEKNVTKKLFIPNINKNSYKQIQEEKIIKEKNVYSFNDFSNKNNVNFNDYKKENENDHYSSKVSHQNNIKNNYNQAEEMNVKDKMNISSTLKKLKYYWRGTNQNYPYTYKKVKKCNNEGFSNYHFLECIDISQKIINKKDLENDFGF